MILQVVSEGLRRLITTRVKSNRMLIMRTMLNFLLDALTIGVFQNLQVTANEKRVTTIPATVNTRITIPPGLEYLRLATGKSTQWVLASFLSFSSGTFRAGFQAGNRVDCATRARDTVPTTG